MPRHGFPFNISEAFSGVDWSNFYPPTLKTAVFGFAMSTISSFLGYSTDEGADMGRAATRGVVVSSLVIIFLDVLLIKFIFFIFPETAAL